MAEFIIREACYSGTVKRDVVGELIRCKDCRHNSGLSKILEGYYHCDYYEYSVMADDFCSQAMQKDGKKVANEQSNRC